MEHILKYLKIVDIFKMTLLESKWHFQKDHGTSLKHGGLWSRTVECVNFLEEPPEGEMNALSGNGPKAMRIEEADAAGINSVFFWVAYFGKT